MTRTAAADAVMSACPDAAAACPAVPARRSRANYPAHRVGLSSGICARFTGTRTRGTPQRLLDGLLIPEGTTSHDYSSVRRDGPGGPEHREPGYLPAGTVRAAVPRHRGNRGDLLPLHP